MDEIKAIIPLLAAIVSAMAPLCGYIYQKHKDKETELLKIRQEIYSRLIT